MLQRFLKPLASLRLTIFCLLLAFILVFVGTLAQVHNGLYEVQSRYFRSWIVFWKSEAGGAAIPIFPGGWLIGAVLVLNLMASLFTRFKFTPRKTGLWIVHLGIILLLVGQFVTEAFQAESQMRIEIGETKNYSEDFRKNELVILDTAATSNIPLLSITETALSKKEIKSPGSPFTIKVKNYFPNSYPVAQVTTNSPKTLFSTNGIGPLLCFTEVPVKFTMDEVSHPAALVEIFKDNQSLGEWLVSTWLSKAYEVSRIREWLGEDHSNGIARPQCFTNNGHAYEIALRPKRIYRAYSLTLLEFHHDLHEGSSIDKNFSSRVRLSNPATSENRDILIHMNNPLRYQGDTYYQSGFEPGDQVTILQVVRNPASLIPYIASTMITLGLIIQFLMHLTAFIKKRMGGKS